MGINKQILSFVLDNEEGVLARLTGLITAKGYSIENINAGTTNIRDNTSCMTVMLYETDERIKKLVLQLQQQIPVRDVKIISNNNVEKELVLVNAKNVEDIVKKYDAEKVKDNIYQLISSPDVVNHFVKELNDRECFAIVRSGVVAIGE